jgi:hypothetical protein
MRDQRTYLADERNNLMLSGCNKLVKDFSGQFWQLSSAMRLVSGLNSAHTT